MSKHEQVIKGSISAESAERHDFKVIDFEKAVVQISVESQVRQVGHSIIAQIIQKALQDAGYENTHILSDDRCSGNLQEVKKELPMFEENKMPKLKINIIDRKPY